LWNQKWAFQNTLSFTTKIITLSAVMYIVATSLRLEHWDSFLQMCVHGHWWALVTSTNIQNGWQFKMATLKKYRPFTKWSSNSDRQPQTLHEELLCQNCVRNRKLTCCKKGMILFSKCWRPTQYFWVDVKKM